MGKFERAPDFSRAEFASYVGRWVALINGQIVGQGGTPEQAKQAAKAARFKETPQVFFVSFKNPFKFSSIITEVLNALPKDQEIYLVGGAVRDTLLLRQNHDFDFVLPCNALRIAKKVANKIGAAYFPLDEERQTARLIVDRSNEIRLHLDFATFRGDDLEVDLSHRDFTINAMAVDLRQPQKLYDPKGGAADLKAGRLVACSPGSFDSDPIRILRAIRFAAKFNLRIMPETLQSMREGIGKLERVSPERIRDELFNILSVKRVATSVRALDMLGVLEIILPDLVELKNLQQSPPHTQDAWKHTLETLAKLEDLLASLRPITDSDSSESLMMGLAAMRLGRYRQHIDEFANFQLVTDRSIRPLLFFAALYHDVGKPESKTEQGEKGRIRFIKHERIGAEIASRRGRSLALSNAEIEWLEKVVFNHMRPTWLARETSKPSRRAVYRFFRDTGTENLAGVAVCLISLADLFATYGVTLPQQRWARQLDIVRTLLDGQWQNYRAQVNPPVLVSGNDLMKRFELNPGPQIGEILELIREAQAAGEVNSQGEAFRFVEEWFRSGNGQVSENQKM